MSQTRAAEKGAANPITSGLVRSIPRLGRTWETTWRDRFWRPCAYKGDSTERRAQSLGRVHRQTLMEALKQERYSGGRTN